MKTLYEVSRPFHNVETFLDYVKLYMYENLLKEVGISVLYEISKGEYDRFLDAVKLYMFENDIKTIELKERELNFKL